MGTPPYLAPEQVEHCRDAIGPSTDIYALGVILAELVSGAPPFDGRPLWPTLRAILEEPPEPPRRRNRRVPRDLEAIALRCLEKRPADRYPTSDALADDLGRFLAGQQTVARPLGRVRRAFRWSQRHPAATALVGVRLLTVAVSLGAATALERANWRLERANAKAGRALEAERHQHYVAALALAESEARRGRIEPAQQRLIELVPGPGEPDLRDFAWHYLYRQLRADRTLVGTMPGVIEELTIGPDGTLMAGIRGQIRCWQIREHPATAPFPVIGPRSRRCAGSGSMGLAPGT